MAGKSIISKMIEQNRVKKKTSIGNSPRSRYNKKYQSKKKYRGQGK